VSKTTGYVAERNKPFIKNIISSMLPMFVVEGDIILHQPTFLEADLYRKMKNKSDMMIHKQIFERLNPYLPKGGKRMTATRAKRAKRATRACKTHKTKHKTQNTQKKHIQTRFGLSIKRAAINF
jgi:hypothetical protein